MQKALNEVYKQIVELKKSRGDSKTPSSNTTGSLGASEVTQNADGTYTLRVRHGDGWVTFQAGADQFTK